MGRREPERRRNDSQVDQHRQPMATEVAGKAPEFIASVGNFGAAAVALAVVAAARRNTLNVGIIAQMAGCHVGSKLVLR